MTSPTPPKTFTPSDAARPASARRPPASARRRRRGSPPRKRQRRRAPDTPAPARHDRDLILQSQVHHCSFDTAADPAEPRAREGRSRAGRLPAGKPFRHPRRNPCLVTRTPQEVTRQACNNDSLSPHGYTRSALARRRNLRRASERTRMIRERRGTGVLILLLMSACSAHAAVPVKVSSGQEAHLLGRGGAEGSSSGEPADPPHAPGGLRPGDGGRSAARGYAVVVMRHTRSAANQPAEAPTVAQVETLHLGANLAVREPPAQSATDELVGTDAA